MSFGMDLSRKVLSPSQHGHEDIEVQPPFPVTPAKTSTVQSRSIPSNGHRCDNRSELNWPEAVRVPILTYVGVSQGADAGVSDCLASTSNRNIQRFNSEEGWEGSPATMSVSWNNMTASKGNHFFTVLWQSQISDGAPVLLDESLVQNPSLLNGIKNLSFYLFILYKINLIVVVYVTNSHQSFYVCGLLMPSAASFSSHFSLISREFCNCG